MKFFIDTFKSFKKSEIVLWVCSVVVITLSFIIFKNDNYLTLSASLVGTTSLIFMAKGNVIGPFLVIVFAILYAIVSYTYHYYGEMISYLGMTAPIAIISIVTWLRNSYNGNKTEVKVNTLKRKEYVFLFFLSSAITVAFYFILREFNTANLIVGTISVFTSFTASYLELRRCRFYAVCFMVNDVVLIVLWILATIDNFNYLSMVICFVIFILNDIYSYICWSKIKKKQSNSENITE